MAFVEITYEQYMKKLDEAEKRYLSDEPGFPEGAKEKGLETSTSSGARSRRLGPRTLFSTWKHSTTCRFTSPGISSPDTGRFRTSWFLLVAEPLWQATSARDSR
jgi:hypothetical protein